jgi:hypothetical protein
LPAEELNPSVIRLPFTLTFKNPLKDTRRRKAKRRKGKRRRRRVTGQCGGANTRTSLIRYFWEKLNISSKT